MGAILYEMAAGRRAFHGTATAAILYSIVNEQAPPLGGSPEAETLNGIIQKALEKSPARRYPTAAAMAEALQQLAEGKTTTGTAPAVRTVTRLIVLPFRMLAPDAETDFLAFSLPDAVASTLAQSQSLVVRSTLVASRFAGENPDLRAIASQAEVDAVLTGTLLRAGNQVRLTTQLIEVPSGTLIHASTSQTSLHDLFRLQDELTSQVVESLSIRLSAREDLLLKRDVPATPSAYEYYLRANQHFYDWRSTPIARDLYLECIERDPHYAPAWARLGRCYRLLGKFTLEPSEHLARGEEDANLARAEEAFRKALEINPDLAMAHNLYAHLEADLGRAPAAMERLLKRAKANPRDADAFAGLVHVCRYCGLLDASIEAHFRARRIDPQIPTSVAHTYFMRAEYERSRDLGASDIGYMQGLTLVMLGRDAEALGFLQEQLSRGETLPIRMAQFLRLLLLIVKGSYDEAADGAAHVFEDFVDPEGHFYWARSLSRMGRHEESLERLRGVVDSGYFCADALRLDPWLDPIRETNEFRDVQRRAEQRRESARAAFAAAGGVELLGVS
jgi:TolB-like protein